MKPYILFPLLIISFIVLSSSSCSKPASSCNGGKGGSASIAVTPSAHKFFLDSCTIYIKYGTLDQPANGIYDDSMVPVIVDTTPVANFKNLQDGCYYIYVVGYHPGFSPPNVKGGASTQVQNGKSVTLYIPTIPYIP